MKKVFVLLKNGFEEIEALTVVDYLRRADIEVNMVSMEEDLMVEGGHQIQVKADIMFDDLDKDQVDLVYIPGGMDSSLSLRDDERVLDLLNYLDSKDKTIASMCAGPMVLDRAGLLEDKTATSFPSIKDELKNLGKYSDDVVVVSENVITSRGPATAVFLALELIEILKGQDMRKDIEESILFEYIR